MKAAVVRAPGTVALEEVQLAEPGTGEVLVRLVATGVCHTDLSAMTGGIPMMLPLVLGHEGAGVVEQVGPGVIGLEPGDHVVLSITLGCGHCFQCRTGAPGLCEASSLMAMTGSLLDGTTRLADAEGVALHHMFCQSSFAERAVVPAIAAVKVRPDVPLEHAALLGCGAMTGLGAVINRAQVRAGEGVLIIGAGGVGLAAVLAAVAVGAAPIIVADRSTAALDAATQMGASHVIDSSVTEIAPEVMALTGRGIDHAIDAVGAPGTVEAALQATREGGQVVVVGIMDAAALATVPIFGLIRERRLTGSYGGSCSPHVDVPRFVDLYMSGRLPLDRLVTRTYSLDEVPTALDELATGRAGRGVILL